MARPVGKYFASVIRKIVQAKEDENIVVDERFKSDLRANLLVKAESVRSAGFDWGAFFSKWKYALAAVPSACIVFLLAFSLAEMPLRLRNKPVDKPVVRSEAPGAEGGVEIKQDVLVKKNLPAPDEEDAEEESMIAGISGYSGYSDAELLQADVFKSVPEVRKVSPENGATYSVSYEAYFSPQDMVSLDKAIRAMFRTGNAPKHISVGLGGDGVVVLAVRYADGTEEVRYVKRSSELGNWE